MKRTPFVRRAAVLTFVATVAGGSLAAQVSAVVGQVPVTCGGGEATIVGTNGDDHLVGTPGDDVIVGGDGSDVIDGGGGRDAICGGPGTDTLLGGAKGDFLSGGHGADVLDGGPGSDSLMDDTEPANGDLPSASDDILRGGPGADRIVALFGENLLDGGPGDDQLEDQDGDSVLRGGDGADLLSGGPGDDAFDGGPGADWVTYGWTFHSGAPSVPCVPVVVDLAGGTAEGLTTGTDAIADIENVEGGSGSDVLIGDDQPNVFFPGENCRQQLSERIVGNGGVDHLTFVTEHSAIVGHRGVGVWIDLDKGRGRLPVGKGKVVRFSLQSIENVTGTGEVDRLLGSSGPNVLDGSHGFGEGPEVIRGRGGADVLSGGWGAQRLFGGGGPDMLFGRLGPDHLDGGPGRDTLHGGNGVDTCVSPQRGPLAVACEG